jgi:hypothetical protein
MKQGILIILSGPAGIGKGSVRKLAIHDASLHCFCSVLDTTKRKKFKGKEPYHFISPYEFYRRKEAGFYLATFESQGNLYGIQKEEILQELASGKNIVLDVDVPIALKLMEQFRGMYTLTVFIQPPNLDELRRRLNNSHDVDKGDIDAKIKQAEEDLKSAPLFDVVLTNYVLKKTFKRFVTSLENRTRYILSIENNTSEMENYLIKRP